MNNKPWDARLAYRLIYPLRNSRVTPNHLTSVRLLFGIFACAGLSTGDYFWVNIGAFCFVISNFLDHSDGELARLTGKMSKSGHYFDLASDAIVNILLFVGIGAGLMHGPPGNWALLMGVVSGLSVAAIFHMRNEIEKSIGKDDARQPNIGIIEAEDILYLLPIITLMGWLVPFLILAVIGAPAYALWTLKEYRELLVKPS
jgi:archaetidylinositol phosphate synthase